MEITEKEKFKTRLREEIAHYIGHFPYYFWINIVINLLVLFFIIATAVSLAFIVVKYPSELIYYGLIFLAGLLKVFSITFRNFLKNIRILSALFSDYREDEIAEYEFDHAAELVRSLPMEKAEMEKVRVSLSHEKLLNVLELIGIIVYENGEYDLNVKLKVQLINEDIVRI